MKKVIYTTLFAALAGTAVGAMADDVNPDKVLELVEQGQIKHLKELNSVAQELHPDARIVETEVEDSYGKYIYSVELRDDNNTEWNVDIDAVSGEVLKNQPDDD